ncbi:MAG: hypothetical protein E5W09_28375 [Mesorhizobium sp.]|nr:MAG: hypothetical protein E5W09_28375 [Mesorhizobium sp.]
MPQRGWIGRALFRPQPSASANSNFVQTVPGKGWFIYFRLYGPKQAYFDRSWQLPDIEEVTYREAGLLQLPAMA